MNPKVNEFLEKIENWSQELSLLRKIILDCGLIEEFKWMHPCYTFHEKNIVLIHGFKDYCSISFFKGALLKDQDQVLVQATDNVQSGRQIRFRQVTEIVKQEEIIKSYIIEAIEVEKAGLKFESQKVEDFDIPVELIQKFSEVKEVKTAFDALTPGRQKGYLLYFSQPKQSKTRTARIEKSVSRIMLAKGIHDCICGMSKRMPTCDGSHKLLD